MIIKFKHLLESQLVCPSPQTTLEQWLHSLTDHHHLRIYPSLRKSQKKESPKSRSQNVLEVVSY